MLQLVTCNCNQEKLLSITKDEELSRTSSIAKNFISFSRNVLMYRKLCGLNATAASSGDVWGKTIAIVYVRCICTQKRYEKTLLEKKTTFHNHITHKVHVYTSL